MSCDYVDKVMNHSAGIKNLYMIPHIYISKAMKECHAICAAMKACSAICVVMKNAEQLKNLSSKTKKRNGKQQGSFCQTHTC